MHSKLDFDRSIDQNVSALLQIRENPKKSHHSWVCIEGEGDAFVLEQHRHPDCSFNTIEAHPKVTAKDTVEGVVRKLNAISLNPRDPERMRAVGYLGIVDADFYRLDGRTPTVQNLLVTDRADFDVDVWASPDVFREMISAEADIEKVASIETDTGSSLYEMVLGAAAEIGYIRWLNHRENLFLKFKGIEDFSIFMDARSLSVNETLLIEALIRNTVRPECDTEGAVRMLGELKRSYPDLPIEQLVQGHDLARVFGFGALTLFGNISNKQRYDAWNRFDYDTKIKALLGHNIRIERDARRHYGQTALQRTELYRDVRDWENRTGYRVFH